MEAMKTKRRELDIEELKKVVDECISEGAIHILITGGEPFTSKNIFKLIEYVKSKNLICTIATNSLLIDNEKAKRLKELKVDLIEASLDSVNPDEHDTFRGRSGTYEKFLASLQQLAEHKVPSNITYVIRKENIDYVDKVYNLAKSHQMGISMGFASPVGNWEGREDKKLTGKEWAAVDKHLKTKNIRWCGDASYLKKGCAAGSEKVYINPYGEVTPCPLIPKVLGNIQEEGLNKIRQKMLRRARYRTVHHRCLAAI